MDGVKIPAILTRESSGHYSLTSRPMVLSMVDGERVRDVYVAPGDGLGIRHLCPLKAEKMFGMNLSRFESIQVELTGRVVEGAVPVKLWK